MGAIVLADPGLRPVAGPRRYAVPAVLIAGWGGLFAYSAAYLTEDLPFRPAPAGAVQRADLTVGLPADDIPRRIVVLPAPEAAAPQAPVSQAPALQAPAPQAPVVQAPPRPAVAALPDAPAARAVIPAPPRPATPLAPDFVGVWGPTPAACGARSRRRGYLPATITADRAKAGRTVCSFHDGRRVGNAWVTAAECSDRGRRWSSQVHLVVDGDRLTWSSSRGTAAYTRCARKAG
ncbi:peptidase inhibitor family I36 protein [Methylobacterium sp. NEAU 140]|uniref:peptidase inhibitor family I36 protein n=1 Tax=Methylobacterium sp. NEAU 140 TaxID=3064945 RepID=UPI0027332161|nr:peptidase inhibitor family I36 protein [Methylobacterium sp. NEAU 140]MDP4025706.1 peptidase inhibitor family I36 protein [Methylobacterium sp. NEAU 140]